MSLGQPTRIPENPEIQKSAEILKTRGTLNLKMVMPETYRQHEVWSLKDYPLTMKLIEVTWERPMLIFFPHETQTCKQAGDQCYNQKSRSSPSTGQVLTFWGSHSWPPCLSCIPASILGQWFTATGQPQEESVVVLCYPNWGLKWSNHQQQGFQREETEKVEEKKWSR